MRLLRRKRISTGNTGQEKVYSDNYIVTLKALSSFHLFFFWGGVTIKIKFNLPLMCLLYLTVSNVGMRSLDLLSGDRDTPCRVWIVHYDQI